MIDTIIKSFDIWTDAQGLKSKGRVKSIENISLEGISQLRKFILNVAVTGKLVPQDAKDEPALELLKNIYKEKNSLASKGIISKPKQFSKVTEEEKVFVLPAGWEWIRLGELGNWALGSGFPAIEQGLKDQEILFAKVSDMNNEGNEKFIYNTANTISEKTARKLKINIHNKGTVIFPKIGGAISTNKRRIIVKPTAIDNNCLGVTPLADLSEEYLFLFLLSIDLSKFQVGTSVPALSQGVLELIPLGLPPLSEQHRIVAKVDELMALCHKLEEEQYNNLKTHQVLVKTLLETLTQAADANELQAAWERMSAHFDTLFCTEDSIDQLKQTILQLAVMGKLVKQDLNDEPASELIIKIAKEKERLIEEGKIRKQAVLPEIKDNEKLFILPESWEWCRLQDLISLLGDGIHGTPEYEENGEYYFVNGNNLSNGIIEIKSNTKTVTKKEYQKHKRDLNERTILVSINGTIGNTAFYNNEKIILGKSACYFNLLNSIEKEYIRLFITSKYFLDYAFSEATGTTIQNVSLRTMRSLLIPLPPFNEQQKIIQKVEELLSLCRKLSLKIIESQNIKVQLSKTIVEKAVR